MSSDLKDWITILLVYIAILVGAGFIGSVISAHKWAEFGAMEVYKGNTVMQYTIVDGDKN